MKPPWNRRETLVVTGGSIPIIALHSTVQEAVDEREKMTALMQDFRSQYNKWISSPHHIFIVPAQSAINPIRNPISNHNAEITNLGILERKLPVVWEGTTTGERLVVEDFYLGLRRSAPVLSVLNLLVFYPYSWPCKDDTCVDSWRELNVAKSGEIWENTLTLC